MAAAQSTSDTPHCDLVMKGGITSGVVYPKLIASLAEKYRFKNIGGTSAGAIAAAACAAAEFRRATTGERAGFDALSKLPEQLSEKIGTPSRSRLFHLFQPAPAVAPHFAVLVSMLNAPHPLAAIGRALLAMVWQFRGIVLLGALLALLLFAPVVSMAAPGASHGLAVGCALVLLGFWWLWAAYGLRRLDTLTSSPVLAPLLWWVLGLAATALVLRFVVQAAGGAHLWVATFACGVAAPLTIGLALALSGLRFGITLVKGMHGNGYGICSGRTMQSGTDTPQARSGTDAQQARSGADTPQGLTDWLTGYFNSLAGLSDERPLSFGDLWGARRDGDRFVADDNAPRRTNLEVMTTAISQQMCFSVPFRDGIALYYDRDEWARLFPESVMRWIERTSALDAQDAARATPAPRVVHAPEHAPAGQSPRQLTRLPTNVNLPVVVAVRMSLSFPGLLSAVPLYAVDRSRRFNQSTAQADSATSEPLTLRATRVWFSDGGIASNMPLHFFDAPLPGHPTFAVNLKAEHPDFPIDASRKASEQPGRVYLPEDNRGGLLRHWPEPKDGSAVGGLVGFLSSIVHTMQNWRDELLFPYPGYRDRIVQVSQLDDEGGLNLDMPKGHIENLSDAGEFAAQRLIARFFPPEPQSGGWKNHREVRLRTFLGVLEEMALALEPKLADGRWSAVVDGIAPDVYSQRHDELAKDCLKRLAELAEALGEREFSLQKRAPSPRASMRIAPRI
jgi:predicted acylesterase/phospholipase RssA